MQEQRRALDFLLLTYYEAGEPSTAGGRALVTACRVLFAAMLCLSAVCLLSLADVLGDDCP